MSAWCLYTGAGICGVNGFLTVGDGDNHSCGEVVVVLILDLLQRVIYNVCLGLDDYSCFYITM